MRKIFFLLRLLIRYPVDKYKGNVIHKTARLSKNVFLAKAAVGKGTYIASNTVIINTQIGNYSSIAPAVQIGGMQHSYWWLSTSTRLSSECISNKRTTIGHDVWIGAGSIIKQGVIIGDGAVIGAMSFVNKDVPENTIYFGSPAQFYKRRLDSAIFENLKKSQYWLLDEQSAKQKLKELDKK